ncbi:MULTISPECIES: hypothetical protein [unclassified Lysobacter]|uniref:hypothetical protein n=1 Tax=unclassified Lysobacter TaxID=2635362 RepID=UPI001BEC980A|nr:MULTISPECIES: hypothetical protein [unclassified Lysobacter]MBT2749445.1 hypothetical protein [Lysobacter sp. ISL-42]MBT2753977.1 hypothetical protein [Lysobacter sp. ISL-50]MBT2778050.1 hypothetical protein [Lysobacter sp. ISL-54]MBT2780735.1 hypothetical protein [Lysobacter sp. ISL-52]
MYWLGIALCLIGGLWIVVNAFRKSIWWGLGSLIIPLVALVFAIMNFAENKIPLAIYVVGFILLIVGMPSTAGYGAPV